MNEGVKILLERMESNPEDFMENDFDSGTGRMTAPKFRWASAGIASLIKGEGWTWAVYLTPEEIDALKAAFIKHQRDYFTNRVMEKLLVEEKGQEYGVIAQPVQHHQAMTWGSNGSLGIGTAPPSGFYTANSAGVGTQSTNAVTIAPYSNGPSIDFNAKTITALNEMIGKWSKNDE